MESGLNRYIYRGDQPFKLVKWKVKIGSQIFANTVILTYIYPNSNTEMKLKSNVDGTVLSLLVKEKDLVHPGETLLELQSCTHEVIIKELCAQCGADLRQLSRQSLQEVVASRSFSMVHIVPELRCSLKQAKQLDEADEARLLAARKLILLVDLDQTLIHTTNDNVPIHIKDVHHFQLYGANSPWYHTKLRPSTQLFLDKISQLYELHIFTFGARMYAHKIASILDPDGKLFSHRILSRDECFDATSKTGNLKTLFPRGDSMVCIIDDREDIWNFTPNVVHVKPYIFFHDTGDINAPPVVKQNFFSEPTANDNENHADPTGAEVEETKENSCNSTQSPEDVSIEAFDESQEEMIDNPCEPSSTTSTENVPENKKESDDDDDDYLLYLEDILTMIHKAYFDIYDEMSIQKTDSIPDLKNVIPYVRKKILQGVNIVFSGVIPTNMAPEKSLLWMLAKSFGANVSTDLVLGPDKDRTTHIIATKMGTAKLNRARRLGSVHIVTPSWLVCCSIRWEKADERLFPLKKNTTYVPELTKKFKKINKAKGGNLENHGSAKKRKGNDFKFSAEDINPNSIDISTEELEDMGREVEELCAESGEESDNGETTDCFSSTKVESCTLPLSSNNSQQLSIDSSNESSSVCSEDEELASAVMHRLMNCIPNSNT